MHFVLQTFRFKTRLQQLDKMEGSARANLNFLEQLIMYHKQYNSVDIVVPIIGGKTVDLLRLRREVNSFGGYAEVSSRAGPVAPLEISLGR